MKKSIVSVAALALALTAGSALAADLPSHKGPPPYIPPPPLMTWTGFYVGLNAGYTWSESNWVNTGAANIFDAVPAGLGVTQAGLATFTASANTDGFIGGGQIGYNWQFAGNFVAGIEADIQGVASSGSSSSVLSAAVHPGFGLVTQAASVSKSLDYLGTVRGRLGWLFTPSLLVYGTGGLAYGGVTANTSIFQANPPVGVSSVAAVGSFSDTRVGWTAGGGLEWMFWPNWSAKVEYLYYDLGEVAYNVGPLVSALVPPPGPAFISVAASRTRFDGHIVRAGLNYHFNWGAAPVVAKY